MQLVADYKQSGDPACIEILFNRYSHLVLAVAMKYLHNTDESKDVVLEIFGKLPEDLVRYEIKDFSHWIYIVTRNRCYHELKIRNHTLPADSLDHRLAEESPEPFNEGDPGGLLMEHLEESLATLREEQRICIWKFYLEEKSYEEIERETGYTYKQVKSYIQNGKRNLRNYLERFIK